MGWGGGGAGGTVPVTSNKGFWNASTNTPDYTTTITAAGDFLTVSTAGTQTITGLGSTTFAIGDQLVRTATGFAHVPAAGGLNLSGIADNSILMVSGNSLAASSILESGNRILMGKATDFMDDGLRQTAIEYEERGGFTQSKANTSGRSYIGLDYQIDDSTGTVRPKWFPRQAVETRVILQSDLTQTLTNLTNFTRTLTTDSDVQKVYFNLVNPITNFRMRIKSTATNLPIKYFPSEMDWENNTGSSLSSGEVSITFSTPLAAIGQLFNIEVDVAADQAIDVLGSTTEPWFAVDRQQMTFDGVPLLDSNSLVEGTNITIAEDTGNNTFTINSTATPFNPATVSVTDLNDVTSAGSGAIITSAERTKLTSLTVRSQADIEDIVGGMVSGNTETGITVTYDTINNKLDFTVTGVSPPLSPHQLYLDVTLDNLAASVDIVNAVATDILNPTLTIPTFTANSYLQVLQAQTHTRFTSIVIGGLNQIGTFTINDSARTIGGTVYRQYVTTNMVTSVLSGDTITLGGAT